MHKVLHFCKKPLTASELYLAGYSAWAKLVCCMAVPGQGSGRSPYFTETCVDAELISVALITA
jgi:hypothetical protein